MPRQKPRKYYPPEFKARIVELHRAGRSASSLSDEFNIHPTTIRVWTYREKVDAGEVDGLTTDERAELAKLRRENAQLREEKEILKTFAAWSAQESNWTSKKRSGS